MKNLISPHSGHNTKNLVLLLLRIVAGVLLMTHGHPKLMKLLSEEPVQFASIMGMSAQLSLTLAMFAEFFCAILIILGLFTRIAVIPIIITMSVVIFIVHWDDPFGRKELPLLYLMSYVAILLMGAGKYSLDYLLHQKLTKVRPGIRQ